MALKQKKAQKKTLKKHWEGGKRREEKKAEYILYVAEISFVE